jgi:HK97 gp10 family phage protein
MASKVDINTALLKKMVQKVADEYMLKLSLEIVDEAKRIVPVDTGRLQNAIGIKSARTGKIEVGTDDTAPYAMFVEFGTKNMPPQPFMRPAVQIVRSRHIS